MQPHRLPVNLANNDPRFVDGRRGWAGRARAERRTTQHTRRGQGQEKPLGQRRGRLRVPLPLAVPVDGCWRAHNAKPSREGRCPAARRAWQRREGSPKSGQRVFSLRLGHGPSARCQTRSGVSLRTSAGHAAPQDGSGGTGGGSEPPVSPIPTGSSKTGWVGSAHAGTQAIGGCLPDTGEGLRAITP